MRQNLFVYTTIPEQKRDIEEVNLTSQGSLGPSDRDCVLV